MGSQISTNLKKVFLNLEKSRHRNHTMSNNSSTAQHRALVLPKIGEPFEVKSLPLPTAIPGSAVVRVNHVGVISYHREIYNGELKYPFPTPLVGGMSAVGRIHALGPDAVSLQKGQLVFIDCVVRARDDPDTLFLSAIHESGTEASKKLMRDVWRDGTFAEYARVPLENCIPLNEHRLCQELGYGIIQLTYLFDLLVPYGGLRDIGLEPGETLVCCQATGGFGGAAVMAAAAMGARVVAMSRDPLELVRLKQVVERGIPGAIVETVTLTDNVEEEKAALDALGTIDAVLDMSPIGAPKSSRLGSAINALRRNGRVSLMGMNDHPVSTWKTVGDNIVMKGKLMYEREDMRSFIKLLELGRLPKGSALVDAKSYDLSDWRAAFDEAATYSGVARMVVLTP